MSSLQEAILNDLGLSSSPLEMLPSFEARNLRRASRSHAHTGFLKTVILRWRCAKNGKMAMSSELADSILSS